MQNDFFSLHLPSHLKSASNCTAFIAINNLGRQTLKKTLSYLKTNQLTWQDFWVGKNQLWQKIGISNKQELSIKKFIKEQKISDYYQRLINKGIRVVTYWESAYPQLLKQTTDPPIVLFVKAKNFWARSALASVSALANFCNTSSKNLVVSQVERNSCQGAQTPLFDKNLATILNAKRPMAVVGTRHMTHYGEYIIQKILAELQFFLPTIVSGFMYGVDFCAHQTALELGLNTIGILGYGFDYIYPKSLNNKFNQFYEKGMIFLSEYPPEYQPRAGNFVQRNRLIAGLSSGVFIPEANQKSGSLITANYAIDYGREIFITPGQVANPYIAGLIDLANNGALMISNGQEIAQELGWTRIKLEGKESSAQAGIKNDFLEKKAQLQPKLLQSILQLLTSQSLDASQVASCLKVNLPTAQVALAKLFLEKQIRLDGGLWGV